MIEKRDSLEKSVEKFKVGVDTKIWLLKNQLKKYPESVGSVWNGLLLTRPMRHYDV